MYAEMMRANGFVEIDLHVDYMSALANELMTDDVQTLWVQPLTADHLLIKESSGLLDEYKLFFGDEILVDRIGEKSYKLKSVIDPSPMCHFFFFGSGHPNGATEILHEMGGGVGMRDGRADNLPYP